MGTWGRRRRPRAALAVRLLPSARPLPTETQTHAAARGAELQRDSD
eukprot:CAMPEP_0195107400 /NCGR_PEP_ID=MMETSP0448-20130528/82061_1 /TAXON_ID=66468 /ORGANISM="Heterocapsa triquestra, Strain CCMP 448" /LENGTH=45 /DNA_ID= /DNA_START= /DNA_END= /DNA_ORIENTATION=